MSTRSKQLIDANSWSERGRLFLKFYMEDLHEFVFGTLNGIKWLVILALWFAAVGGFILMLLLVLRFIVRFLLS